MNNQSKEELITKIFIDILVQCFKINLNLLYFLNRQSGSYVLSL